jgi:hypothetical protein
VTLGLLALLWGAAPAAPALADDAEERIRAAFETYKQGVLERKGEQAASVLSPATLGYYGRLQRDALFARREKVRTLPPLERVQVFFYRVSIPGEELVRMSPEELFAHAIESGWVGRQEMAQTELGAVEIDGQSALAQHMTGGAVTGVKYRFVQDPEDGGWRFDLLPTLLTYSEVTTEAAMRSGLQEQELVVELFQSTSGRPWSDELWEPLFPEAPEN